MWPELGLWQYLAQGQEKAEVTRCFLPVSAWSAGGRGPRFCSLGRWWASLVLSEAKLYCELDGLSAGRSCPGRHLALPREPHWDTAPCILRRVRSRAMPQQSYAHPGCWAFLPEDVQEDVRVYLETLWVILSCSWHGVTFSSMMLQSTVSGPGKRWCSHLFWWLVLEHLMTGVESSTGRGLWC